MYSGLEGHIGRLLWHCVFSCDIVSTVCTFFPSNDMFQCHSDLHLRLQSKDPPVIHLL